MGLWKWHEFVDLNLSFEENKSGTAQIKPSAHVSPSAGDKKPPLVFMAQSYASRAGVDVSFAGKALSTNPVTSASKDAEQAETRPRWRHAAESAVWPQTTWMWRPSVRSLGTASTIVCDPGVHERTRLCGGSPHQRRAHLGITAGRETARRSS